MTNLDRVCCTENNNNLYTSPPNQTARFSPQPLPAYYSPHLCSQRCRREVGETNRTTPLSPSLPCSPHSPSPIFLPPFSSPHPPDRDQQTTVQRRQGRTGGGTASPDRQAGGKETSEQRSVGTDTVQTHMGAVSI